MTSVHDNPAAHRYELAVDGGIAIAAYIQEGDVLTFTHTIVPAGLQGRGVGSRLIAGALDNVRARGMKIRAQCEFVATYLVRHPEQEDLIAA